MGGEVLSAADNDNGAVIFGGRRLHKPMTGGENAEAGGMSTQPGASRDSDAGTGFMQKMRMFLNKKV